MEAVRDFVVDQLQTTFALSLYRSSVDVTRLQVIQAEGGHLKGQKKRYRLTIERDPSTLLFRVKAGSLAVDHDNVAFWHHKQIHRRLKKAGVFGPTKEVAGRKANMNHREVTEGLGCDEPLRNRRCLRQQQQSLLTSVEGRPQKRPSIRDPQGRLGGARG